MEILVLTLLVAHGVMSILIQFQVVQKRVNGFNTASLLPFWSFFAPNPGVNDYRVLARSRSDTGDVGDWREVSQHQDRQLLHIVWNPAKQQHKCLSDCITSLMQEIGHRQDEEHMRDTIQIAWSYLKIARFVRELCDSGPAFQFAIVSTEGYAPRRLQPMFVSKWHRS